MSKPEPLQLYVVRFERNGRKQLLPEAMPKEHACEIADILATKDEAAEVLQVRIADPAAWLAANKARICYRGKAKAAE